MHLNPLKVSEAVYKIVGEVYTVKTLRDGNLLIVCKDRDQQQGLIMCNTLLGKAVKPQIWEERGRAMGVIYGVSTDVTEEEIKVNIRGVCVNNVKRLPYTRDGVKRPSMSVMLALDEDKLPERIRIGYVSYVVRPYIPPPTRCFKCQRFGHTAVACRAKAHCAKCGGGTMNMVNVLKGSKLNVVIVGENIVLRIRDVKHTKEQFKSKM